MTRFRAALLTRIGEPLAIEALDVASLAPGDVLVRLGASGLCHTDLEVMQGAIPLPLPIVLGHEGAGRVEAVGAGVTRGRGSLHRGLGSGGGHPQAGTGIHKKTTRQPEPWARQPKAEIRSAI